MGSPLVSVSVSAGAAVASIVLVPIASIKNMSVIHCVIWRAITNIDTQALFLHEMELTLPVLFSALVADAVVRKMVNINHNI